MKNGGEYKDRFCEAMTLSGKTEHELAAALGVTYQAIKKIMIGATKMPRADHSTLAAASMAVDAEWLATGNGKPKSQRVWPFSPELLAAAMAAEAHRLRQAENAARVALNLDTLPKIDDASATASTKRPRALAA